MNMSSLQPQYQSLTSLYLGWDLCCDRGCWTPGGGEGDWGFESPSAWKSGLTLSFSSEDFYHMKFRSEQAWSLSLFLNPELLGGRVDYKHSAKAMASIWMLFSKSTFLCAASEFLLKNRQPVSNLSPLWPSFFLEEMLIWKGDALFKYCGHGLGCWWFQYAIESFCSLASSYLPVASGATDGLR